MSWLSALEAIFKARKIKVHYDKVKKVYDYSKKIEKADPKKLSWDDLKFFTNKQMTESTKAARDALKLAQAAEKTSLEWPVSKSLTLFLDACKLAEKHGANSKQAQTALKKYTGELKAYDKALKQMLAGLKSSSGELTSNLALAEALQEYAGVLNKAFMKCAAVPALGGTAQNAMFFSLAQDAVQYRGVAGSLATSLKKLQKKNADYLKECQERTKTNQAWITWASNSKAQEDGALKKNTKATLPK